MSDGQCKMTPPEVLALAQQIAKVLDRHGVKPPLNFQEWREIHDAIEAALNEQKPIPMTTPPDDLSKLAERLFKFGPDWSEKYSKDGSRIPYEICNEAATAIRSLIEERDEALEGWKQEQIYAGQLKERIERYGNEDREKIAALTARVGELEAALKEIAIARIPTQNEVVYLDRAERAEATVDWIQKRAAAIVVTGEGAA